MMGPSPECHPELIVDGFTTLDGTVKFYTFVQAAMRRLAAQRILDFGAGRGGGFFDDHSHYRRNLRDLRSSGAHVIACDVDIAVRDHPCSDEQVIFDPTAPLPFRDNEFDVIVSDMVFEHIQDPRRVARELVRVLRPGGFICIRTPNRWGYVRLAALVLPRRLGSVVLKHVQPERREEDVFPAVYLLNSPGQVRTAFEGCEIAHYYDSAEPAYYFMAKTLYKGMLFVHRILPSMFATALCFFIRKPLSSN